MKIVNKKVEKTSIWYYFTDFGSLIRQSDLNKAYDYFFSGPDSYTKIRNGKTASISVKSKVLA